MTIRFTNQMKVDTLHKLLEEYGKQIEWVKDQDFKIVYYSLGLMVAMVVWFAANPPQKNLLVYLYGVITFLGIWSIVALIRNHMRHSIILEKLQNVHTALGLNVPGQYIASALEQNKKTKDLAFHAGRSLYILAILAACILSAIIINSLPVQ
ncbi:hypothetical protein ACFLTX_02960 [Chloroflexota bacterium]